MIDWQPASNDLDRALTKTQGLRSNPRPQWVDVRRRLEALGISPQDVVLASWEPEGRGVMCGLIAVRDGRLIDFCVVYGYDESGRPLDKGVGWVSMWNMIPDGKVGLTPAGYPNSWAQDRIISRMVFELEGEPGAQGTR